MFDETKDHTFPFAGGLDLTPSHRHMNPGKMVFCNNLEIIGGVVGYSVPAGYDRCTNDTLPSDTKVYFFVISSVTADISIGDEFTSLNQTVKSLDNLTNPQDGDVLAVASHDSEFIESSTWTKTGNYFDLDEVLLAPDFTTPELQAYHKQAIEQTRDAIPEITGAGGVHGGFRLRGLNYTFRDDKMFVGGDYGWTEVSIPDVLYFNEGTVEFIVGDTITDGTETGVIASITIQSGVWDVALPAVDQAEGYFTVAGVSGDFALGAVLTDDHTGAGKVAQVNYTYALPNPGKYEVEVYNFTNLVNNESAFGVSGEGDAFEFDGTNYVPIIYPDAVSFPFHIDIHQERLYLAFPGGEWTYSVSGQPRVNNPLLGSGSWSTGSEIVGSMTIHANSQMVFTNETSWMLNGDGIYSDETATRNWSFFEFGEDIGAIQWSIAAHGYPVYMSSAGIYKLKSTQATGGFYSKEIAAEIRTFLRDNKTKVVGSLWCRDKSQYRIFFSTGRAVYVSFYEGKYIGSTLITIPDGVVNVWSEVEGETEYMFFTSSTGYLYRMDAGYTFDTYAREGGFRIPFFSYGKSRIEKQFPQMIIEFDSPIIFSGDTEITYTVNHNYGDIDTPRPISETSGEIQGKGGVYNDNEGYGMFVWSGPIVSEIEAYLDGYGSNMSILITYSTKYDSTFTFMTATVDYIELGRKGQS